MGTRESVWLSRYRENQKPNQGSEAEIFKIGFQNIGLVVFTLDAASLEVVKRGLRRAMR